MFPHCTLHFDDELVNSEFERMAQAFAVGPSADSPLPLTSLVVQIFNLIGFAFLSLKVRLRELMGEEQCTSSNSDFPISHASQLSNPFLGLLLESGKCESCGAAEPGTCEDINCFGDIYVFNLEIQRQHWFISRLDGASVAAGGFTPRNSNVLIISTSSNQVYAFDVEAKQLGEWSIRHTFVLPRRYQEFHGEVIGLSFPPSSN